MAGFDFTNFNPKDPNQWNAFKDYSAGVTRQISTMPLAFTNNGAFDPNPTNYGSSLLPAFGQFFPSGLQYTPSSSTTQSLLGLVNGGSGGGGGSGGDNTRNYDSWFNSGADRWYVGEGGDLANWDYGAGAPSDYGYYMIPAGNDPHKYLGFYNESKRV